MKTNHYECVVIFSATLEDPQIDSTISNLEEQMSANGVEITDIEKWGRKRLAYPINKGKSGYYVIFRFISPREYIAKFERILRLDENIIRFLTIKLEQKDLEFIEKKKAEKLEETKTVVAETPEEEPVTEETTSDTDTTVEKEETESVEEEKNDEKPEEDEKNESND
jgi:small subunit ribosomal protein S6